MKSLLVGGPHDGEIIDTKRCDFGYGVVEDIVDGDGVLQSRTEHWYKLAYGERQTHPCKKKGKVRVLRYVGQNKDALFTE